jgi:hypothetical protein
MPDVMAASKAARMFAMKAYMAQGEFKTIGAFDRQLWSAVLGYFRGDEDSFQFIDDFTNSITNQLTRAWNEGARSVGVDPRDMTDEDLLQLQGIINSEYEHILDLADAIDSARINNKTLDEFRSQFRSRVDLWVNRYNEVVNSAATYFGGKTRLEWQYGDTNVHCETCLKLNGVVAYAEEWEQAGLHPQQPPNPNLECEGWRCQCKLSVTDKRRSPRALNSLMNIVMSNQ